MPKKFEGYLLSSIPDTNFAFNCAFWCIEETVEFSGGSYFVTAYLAINFINDYLLGKSNSP